MIMIVLGVCVSSKITAQYINHMGDDLTIVNAARVSYGKQKDTLDQQDIKLIDYLAKHKHYTPFEHCSLSVKIKCPLYISKQIMRHRTFSYNEVSRRYTDENIEIYEPSALRKQHEKSKQCSAEDFDDKFLSELIKNHNEASVKLYNQLIENGVAREMARGILPQNLQTEFWMSGNLRNWTHFLSLRLDKHAQKEVREVAESVRDIVIQKFPKGAEALFKYME